MSTALALRGVTRWYAGAPAPVLVELDLEVGQGEVVCVLGASGAGKSTLVGLLAGLDAPQAGGIETAGDGRRPALVPQRPDLFPWLSVRENIALGGRYRTNRRRFRPGRVDELLEVLGLVALADSRPQDLSGGQAQRVAVGRALAVDPPALLLDEPFSALDPALRGGLQRWLRGVLDDIGRSAVLVTHDVDEALTVADRVVFLEGPRGITAQWRPRRSGVSRDDVLAHYQRASGPTAGGPAAAETAGETAADRPAAVAAAR